MVEQNEYTAKADKFLADSGILFEARHAEYGKHFADDTQNRDIYECSFTRIETANAAWSNNFSVRFGQSIAGTENGEVPTAFDVLTCLVKDNPGSFDDFCGDYGYDTDSRRAYSQWEAAVAEWQKVFHFFKPAELETIQLLETE